MKVDLPSIEDIVADMDKKAKKNGDATHTPSEKVAGQPKEPGDTSLQVIDPEDGEAPKGGDGEPAANAEETPSAEESDDITPSEEPTPEPPKEEKKDFLSSRFAALSRKEKAARDAQAELERRNAEIEARLKALDEREAKFASAKTPIDVMKAHGWTYQDITESQLGLYKEKEKDPAKVELDERFGDVSSKYEQAQKDIEELKKVIEEFKAEKLQNQTQQFRNSIVDTAKAEGHDLIIEAGEEAIDLVQNVMTSYFQKNKKLLSFSEACATVEAYYQDRISKLASVEKIRSRLVPSAPAASPATKPQKEAKSPNTLTQSLSQGTRAKPNVDEMSSRDALDYLARSLRFNS